MTNVDVTGCEPHVVINLSRRIPRYERAFNVCIRIVGSTVRILPALNSAADVDGARAAIEAVLRPKICPMKENPHAIPSTVRGSRCTCALLQTG